MKFPSSHILGVPATQLGRWSLWLTFGFLFMFVLNVFLNLYIIRPNAEVHGLQAFYILFVIFMLACGLAGGVTGVVAVTKQQERSFMVWVSILCGLFVLLLILNELFQGIQYMLGA